MLRTFGLVLFTLALLPALPAQGTKPGLDGQQLRTEAQAAVRAGDFPAAIAGFRKLTELDPADGRAWHMLGYSLHVAGKLDEALEVHRKATAFPAVAALASYNIACVHAVRKQADEAFAWLDKAIAAGFDQPETLAEDTDMDALRGDPRFAKIVAAAEQKAGSGKVQVFAETVARRCARVAWFTRTGSPGQVAIDWSPVAWQDKYDGMAGKLVGKKWRFGADFWTTLDTSVDLQVGGVAVPAGVYYLTIEQREPGKFVLGVHAAGEVKQQRLDAFQAHKLQGGREVPLAHEQVTEVAKELAIAITMDEGSLDHGVLAVRFGGHQLRAPVVMALGK